MNPVIIATSASWAETHGEGNPNTNAVSIVGRGLNNYYTDLATGTRYKWDAVGLTWVTI
jgi:hypothetical protein